jgi:DNA-3-methyladenine glycosylase I
MSRPSLLTGADGIRRCAWGAATPDYLAYHDQEWGIPVHGERELFERLTLEAFQSGLSWLTILRKRERFRTAFAGFDPEQVAGFGSDDRARLLADGGIVRNARKIDAAIRNAAAVISLRADGGLDALVWSHAPTNHPRPQALEDLRASSPESVALSKALKARGFVFLGPTTLYAAMQACGLVDDHVLGCHRASDDTRKRPSDRRR